MVTWNALTFVVAFAMRVIAILSFHGKDRP
jgi:hypothetical protein